MQFFSVSLNDDGNVMVDSRPLGDDGGDRLYMRKQVVCADKNGMWMGMPYKELAALIWFVTDANGNIIEKKPRGNDMPQYEGKLPDWVRKV